MSPHSRYTCEEAFRRMDDFLDRELTAGEVVLVQQHLDTCATCAGEFAFEGALLRNLKAKLRRIQLPPAVRDRLRRQIESERGNAGGDG